MKIILTFDKFLNEARSSKTDIIENFIKAYTDNDEMELLDMEAEISDIQKMARTMDKKSFVKKIQFQYSNADIKDVEDFFDSMKEKP